MVDSMSHRNSASHTLLTGPFTRFGGVVGSRSVALLVLVLVLLITNGGAG